MSDAGDSQVVASVVVSRLACVALGACALVIMVFGSVAAGKSPALSPGVHVDPNSPAGKEYSIPLSQARGGGSSGAGSLFGSGVRPGGNGPSGPATGGRSPGASAGGNVTSGSGRTASRVGVGSHAAADTSNQSSSAAAGPESQSAASQVLGAGSQGADGIEWMVGAAALVLALGAILAAAVGRLSRSTLRRAH